MSSGWLPRAGQVGVYVAWLAFTGSIATGAHAQPAATRAEPGFTMSAGAGVVWLGGPRVGMKQVPSPDGGKRGTSPFGVEAVSLRLGGFVADGLAVLGEASLWDHLSSNADVSSERVSLLIAAGVEYWPVPRIAAALGVGALLTDDLSIGDEQRVLPAIEARLGLAVVRTDRNALSLVLKGIPLFGEDLHYAVGAGIEWQRL